MWETKLEKPRGFYPSFDRKGGDPQTTHYCPGCGHGVLHKLMAEAIADLGIQDRAILVNPVGCAVFAYYYLDVGNVQASHGRAPAVATGIKRVRPDSIVLCYQGDGDLAAIGGNEILHTANRGENITVLFVNNGIYGMTGGQMAPTTPVGACTVTSPTGRSARNEGYPMRMCELLATLEAPAYIERVALTDPKHHMLARKAVRRAIQTQIDGLGFSFVEILSACPTGWEVPPPEAIQWVEKHMMPIFPLGRFKEPKGKPDLAAFTPQEEQAEPAPAPAEPAGSETGKPGSIAAGTCDPVALKISGFGGQGVLFLGTLMAKAGIREGLHVSWIPSYGPEIRGGTAHCHVRISRDPIASPIIERPTALMAFNQPSVERFAPELDPGGILIVNSSMVSAVPERTDIRVLRVPATEAAKELGAPRAANMVMLGAYLQETRILSAESVIGALEEDGMRPELSAVNRKAIELGRSLLTRT